MKKLTLVLMVLSGGLAFGESTTMADLQALEKQGAWEELVQSLGSIAPAQRDEKWLGLAERGASSYIGELELKTATDGEIALSSIERLIKQYPLLKKSKVFMAKRADVGLTAFIRNSGNSRHSLGEDPWLDAVKAFVAVDTVTPNVPQRAAKMVQGMLMAEVAWPLWQQAIDAGASVCAESDFKKALLMAVADGAWADQTVPAAQKCWSDLKDDFGKALEATKGAKELKRLCAVAQAKELKSPRCK